LKKEQVTADGAGHERILNAYCRRGEVQTSREGLDTEASVGSEESLALSEGKKGQASAVTVAIHKSGSCFKKRCSNK
jgi:hypothetical protein